MSGDIEDFLKRAAERRQARQASRPAAAQQTQKPAARPEYTDSRRERMVRPREDDELIVAEVIEQPLAKRIAELKQKQADAQAVTQAGRAGSASKRDAVAVESDMARNDRNRATRRAADRADAALQSRRGNTPLSAPIAAQTAAAQRNAAAAGQADPANELIEDLLLSLKSPGGLRRAILLHEILDRPVHRW